MSRVLRWTEQAVSQLATIAEYVSLSSPVYAEQLIDRFVQRLEQARVFAESGRVVPELDRPDVRELLEQPYRIVYRVLPDTIEVLAIVHARQLLRDVQ